MSRRPLLAYFDGKVSRYNGFVAAVDKNARTADYNHAAIAFAILALAEAIRTYNCGEATPAVPTDSNAHREPPDSGVSQ